MPLYEYRKNAENSLPLPEETRKSITVGTAASCQKLLEQFAGATAAGAPGVMLIDGWYGVDWASLRKGLAEAARQSGLKLVFASDEKGPDGKPKLNTLLDWETPAKAKMGGRLKCHGGYYLIFEGGKDAAKRVADALNAG